MSPVTYSVPIGTYCGDGMDYSLHKLERVWTNCDNSDDSSLFLMCRVMPKARILEKKSTARRLKGNCMVCISMEYIIDNFVFLIHRSRSQDLLASDHNFCNHVRPSGIVRSPLKMAQFY